MRLLTFNFDRAQKEEVMASAICLSIKYLTERSGCGNRHARLYVYACVNVCVRVYVCYVQ